jgi:hypothetical protein
MKNHVLILLLLIFTAAGIVILQGCDAMEDYAEEYEYSYSSNADSSNTVVIYDTIQGKGYENILPERFEYIVQIGSYKISKNADILKDKADSLLVEKKADIITLQNYYVVYAGKFTKVESANDYLEYVKNAGFPNAYTRKIKAREGKK